MSDNFNPNLSTSSAHNGTPPLSCGSQVSLRFDANSNNLDRTPIDASIEIGRGATGSPFPILRSPAEPEVFPDSPELTSQEFSFLLQFEIPMEERQKVPGCGINHFAFFDEPVRAATSPISSTFFQEAPLRDYSRAAPQQKRQPKKIWPRIGALLNAQAQNQFQNGASLFPSREGLQWQSHAIIRNTDTLSPLTESSPSSSPSSMAASPSFSDFRPLAASTFLQTPPEGRTRMRSRVNCGYLPQSNYFATPPSPSFLPSPRSTVSDQSEHFREETLPESPVPGWGRTF